MLIYGSQLLTAINPLLEDIEREHERPRQKKSSCVAFGRFFCRWFAGLLLPWLDFFEPATARLIKPKPGLATE